MTAPEGSRDGLPATVGIEPGQASTPPRWIDLRSDTVTRPTPAMREAMARAEVGDDVFGDDPTVLALQRRIADLLGFEDALFVTSGTQGNLCALMAHCQRGDEYIVGQMAHCYRWEAGGAAVLGSIQPQPLAHAADGTLPLHEIEAAIKPDDPHYARTRLLCLENTLGGQVMPYAYLQQATALARRHGLAAHLDGARLFNAAVASVAAAPDLAAAAAQEARRIAGLFDSVSVCFSKGLGAPVGSALCGSRELIARARRTRKMLGGGLRQVGVLAAGALHALDHHVARLAEDHALAKRLAQGLEGLPGVRIKAPDTNLVFVEVDRERADRPGQPPLVQRLRAQGLACTGLYQLRFATHLDVTAADIDEAVRILRATL